jgi:hypothetical protein
VTHDDIISAIDQLHAEVIQSYGRGSKTQVAIKKLYDTACDEAKEFEEDVRSSDDEEYVAAHACSRVMDARAVNRERHAWR